MNQTNFKTQIKKFTTTKRSGVAEVISTLLLVVITVVGAVILTTFIDESFVAGSLAVSSGTDVTIKTVKIMAYDTRNGDDLMGFAPDVLYGLTNTNVPPVDDVMCRASCTGDTTPDQGGSDFMVLQIENRSVNSLFLKDIILDSIGHTWDGDTATVPLNTGAADSSGGDYPSNGQFSILSSDTTDLVQRNLEIEGGETVNLLIKLDTTNPDIELSKTVRVQLNIGESSLVDFLIETGDAR